MKATTIFQFARGLAVCERGNTLVDLGLVATLLTATAIGVLEYGAASIQASKLSSAARAAVEKAIKNPADTTGITNVAIRSGNLRPDTLEVSVNQFCECPELASAGCTDTCADGKRSNMFVTVSLSQQAESFLQDSGLMPDFTLARAATMRIR